MIDGGAKEGSESEGGAEEVIDGKENSDGRREIE